MNTATRSNRLYKTTGRLCNQYVLYRLLLNRIEPERTVYLAIPDRAYRELFTEPIGELVINDLPLRLLVVDIEQAEVKKWIPERPIEQSSKM